MDNREVHIDVSSTQRDPREARIDALKRANTGLGTVHKHPAIRRQTVVAETIAPPKDRSCCSKMSTFCCLPIIGVFKFIGSLFNMLRGTKRFGTALLLFWAAIALFITGSVVDEKQWIYHMTGGIAMACALAIPLMSGIGDVILFFVMASMYLPTFLGYLVVRTCTSKKLHGLDIVWPKRLHDFPSPFVKTYAVIDTYDFAIWRAVVYVKGLVFYGIKFLWGYLTNKDWLYPAFLPDHELAEIISDSLFCRNVQKIVFDEITNMMLESTGINRDEIHYMIDFVRPCGYLQMICNPQYHICGVRVLFQQTGGTDGIPVGLKFRAIFLTNRKKEYNDEEKYMALVGHNDYEHEPGFVYTPEDGPHWNCAKVHLMLAMGHFESTMNHSLRHFPMDAINAISSSMLPEQHILYKLIDKHSRFTLQVQRSVLDSSWSALHDWHNNPISMTTYPMDKARENLRKHTDLHYNFEYDKDKLIDGQEFIYNEMCANYYDALFKFICKVMEGQYMCPFVQQWATYCSQWVPGFPDGERIATGNDELLLEKTVASYIYAVCIAHNSDHRAWAVRTIRGDLVTLPDGTKRYKRIECGEEAFRCQPLRMQMPPPYPGAVCPTGKGNISVPRSGDDKNLTQRFKYYSTWDALKSYYFHHLTVDNDGNPFVDSLLRDVDYGFDQNEFRQYNKEFRQDLKNAYEHNISQHTDVIDLNVLRCSIEF